MDERSESESLYHRWLEIPLEYCPPNHYLLLGIEEFETDEAAITSAAKERTAYLHQIAGGPSRKEIQQLLGEVAGAKRTLLNAESRTEYNDWLTSPDEEEEADEEPESEAISVVAAEPKAPRKKPTTKNPATKNPATKKTNAKSKTADAKKGTRPRRKKKSAWDEYKLHAISATVLLGIVGVVWFVNKGGGGRRASQAPTTVSSTPRQPTGVGFRAPDAGASAVPRQAAAQRPTNQRKRVKKPRSSGLVAPDLSGLNAPKAEVATSEKDADSTEPKTATPKSKPETMAAKPKPKASTPEPKPATPESTAPSYALPEDWREKLPVIADLKADHATQFKVKPAAVKFVSHANNALLIKPGAKDHIVLTKLKTRVKVGESIAVDIKLQKKNSPMVKAGLDIGPARVAIASNKTGYQVLTKGLASGRIRPADGVFSEASAETVTMVLLYEKENTIRWIVDTGSKTKSGVIQTEQMTAAVPVKIFQHSPKKKTTQNVWFSNLRYGAIP